MLHSCRLLEERKDCKTATRHSDYAAQVPIVRASTATCASKEHSINCVSVIGFNPTTKVSTPVRAAPSRSAPLALPDLTRARRPLAPPDLLLARLVLHRSGGADPARRLGDAHRALADGHHGLWLLRHHLQARRALVQRAGRRSRLDPQARCVDLRRVVLQRREATRWPTARSAAGRHRRLRRAAQVLPRARARQRGDRRRPLAVRQQDALPPDGVVAGTRPRSRRPRSTAAATGRRTRSCTATTRPRSSPPPPFPTSSRLPARPRCT